MLDWDTLISSQNGELDGTGQKTAESVPACPGKTPIVPPFRDRLEANNGRASEVIVPAVPAEKTREGMKKGKIDADGGVAAE